VRTIRLVIEYDGTNYHGWQRQKKLPSVQEEVEKAIKRLTGEKITLIGSGRTDAGVHSLGQVAAFHTTSSLSPEDFKRALNALLPEDIAIRAAGEAPAGFHPQKSAKWKLYCYRIRDGSVKPVIGRRYLTYVPGRLDTRRMRQAAGFLIGRHDFRSFSTHSSVKNNCIRTIRRLDIRRERESLSIYIEADGFLYNMVRSIAGTLIKVGQGKLSPSEVREILKARDRRRGGPTAPARGLTLIGVKYGEET